MNFDIRHECHGDAPAIRRVTEAAFHLNAHSSGTEGAIVDALRDAGALTLSLVAVSGDDIVGHIAFSPVMIDGHDRDWFGLGPVSTAPDLHGRGIGSALIREGLTRLRGSGAAGCVLLGEPEFYRRFGFMADPALRFDGAPPDYFLRLPFGGAIPAGAVTYHAGFSAT